MREFEEAANKAASGTVLEIFFLAHAKTVSLFSERNHTLRNVVEVLRAKIDMLLGPQIKSEEPDLEKKGELPSVIDESINGLLGRAVKSFRTTKTKPTRT